MLQMLQNVSTTYCTYKLPQWTADCSGEILQPNDLMTVFRDD